MQNIQEKNSLQTNQFEFIFNRELSENVVSDKQQSCEGFLYQSIIYTSQIMICDFIMLLESGHFNNDKLSIQGYIKLMNLIQEFGQNQTKCNKHNILKYCLIQNNNNNLSIVSQINLQINFPTLTDQIDELQVKLSQFVDENQGKDLDELLTQAFNIYQKYNSPIKKIETNNKKDEIFFYIQNRFFIKQYLINQSKDQQQQSLNHFKDIYEIIIIKNQIYFYYILDLLIEVDYNTLEQIYEFIKNNKSLEFNNNSEVSNDFELNKYFIDNLQIVEQKIKDINLQSEWLKSEDKIQFCKNLFNTNLQNLEDNQDQQNDYFNIFQIALINQLKIKFWIFLCELNNNNYQELNDDIQKLYQKYQKSIILKQGNKNHFEKFIKIIVDHDEIIGWIEKTFQFKINRIHDYILKKMENKMIGLKTKLDELYKVNKRIYLSQLKNNPSLTQQVDIILDYCIRIQIMIQNIYNNNFQANYQIKILQTSLEQLEYTNYQNMDFYKEFDQELLQLTNIFCPNLIIFKSTQFQLLKNKLMQNIQKYKLLKQFNQKQKSKIQQENCIYDELNIYKLMKQPQNFDQLQCALYENETWNIFHNQLIKESQKQIELQFKNNREQNFDEEKSKMQKKYENLLFIPIQWIDKIYKNSYEENKQNEIMEQILQFFNSIKEEEQKINEELYGELNDELIQKLHIKKLQYFTQLGKKDYQSIGELEKDVQDNIKKIQDQQSQQYNQIKNLIEKIHNEYSQQCKEIFLKPPQDFEKYKFQYQILLEEQNIKKKIIDFYANQLMENLKLQL